MAVKWYVDKGLATLISQMKDKFPSITVGTIGDAAHQLEQSDHNPEADGSVDAADFMLGTVFNYGDAQWLWNTLQMFKDKRIAYIIFDRKIVSATVSPWVVRSYTGSDPHTNHVHVSVNDLHETDASKWTLDEMQHAMLALDELTLPVLKYGQDDALYDGWNDIARVQELLGVHVDGIYGPETTAALKSYMKSGDGKTIGLKEWTQLYGLSRKSAE